MRWLQRRSGVRRRTTTPKEDRRLVSLVRGNCFMFAPLRRMLMIRRFGWRREGRITTNRPQAVGYWSHHLARCTRLTLEHRRHHRKWGCRQNKRDLMHWKALCIGGLAPNYIIKYAGCSLISYLFGWVFTVHVRFPYKWYQKECKIKSDLPLSKRWL